MERTKARGFGVDFLRHVYHLVTPDVRDEEELHDARDILTQDPVCGEPRCSQVSDAVAVSVPSTPQPNVKDLNQQHRQDTRRPSVVKDATQ